MAVIDKALVIKVQLPPFHLLLVLRHDHRHHRGYVGGNDERDLRFLGAGCDEEGLPRLQDHPSAERAPLRTHHTPRTAQTARCKLVHSPPIISNVRGLVSKVLVHCDGPYHRLYHRPHHRHAEEL